MGWAKTRKLVADNDTILDTVSSSGATATSTLATVSSSVMLPYFGHLYFSGALGSQLNDPAGRFLPPSGSYRTMISSSYFSLSGTYGIKYTGTPTIWAQVISTMTVSRSAGQDNARIAQLLYRKTSAATAAVPITSSRTSITVSGSSTTAAVNGIGHQSFTLIDYVKLATNHSVHARISNITDNTRYFVVDHHLTVNRIGHFPS